MPFYFGMNFLSLFWHLHPWTIDQACLPPPPLLFGGQGGKVQQLIGIFSLLNTEISFFSKLWHIVDFWFTFLVRDPCVSFRVKQQLTNAHIQVPAVRSDLRWQSTGNKLIIRICWTQRRSQNYSNSCSNNERFAFCIKWHPLTKKINQSK